MLLYFLIAIKLQTKIIYVLLLIYCLMGSYQVNSTKESHEKLKVFCHLGLKLSYFCIYKPSII